ncbi:MAG: glycosyltransferase [Microscillaceae bacterium]|nr:glycosyltransferase [Microscillaceae bacterium]
MLAPIALFVYNRPSHTAQCLESLTNNPPAKDSILYIFSDAWRKDASPEQIAQVKAVRQIIRAKQWAKEVRIIEHSDNQGLAHNIPKGITQVLQKYDKIIVLEDDLVLSPYFLEYMNQALDLYQLNHQVMHISGYMYPLPRVLPETFFFNIPSCWGWATWARAWQHYHQDAQAIYTQLQKEQKLANLDLDNVGFFHQILKRTACNELQTWDIQWNGVIALQNGFCLNPKVSLVQNIGLDGSGENTQANPAWQIPKLAEYIQVMPIEVVENQAIRKKVRFLLKYNGLGWQALGQYHLNRGLGFVYKFLPKSGKKFYHRLKSLIFAPAK